MWRKGQRPSRPAPGRALTRPPRGRPLPGGEEFRRAAGVEPASATTPGALGSAATPGRGRHPPGLTQATRRSPYQRAPPGGCGRARQGDDPGRPRCGRHPGPGSAPSGFDPSHPPAACKGPGPPYPNAGGRGRTAVPALARFEVALFRLFFGEASSHLVPTRERGNEVEARSLAPEKQRNLKTGASGW
jgi:hypothetical protein